MQKCWQRAWPCGAYLNLNVAVKLIGEWERGEMRPPGPSLKRLALVKANGLAAIL